MAGRPNVRILFWLLFCVPLCLIGVNGDRITEKIYHKIDGGFSCFRRLNATHQIGCSSSSAGDVGVVHFIENEESLNWLIDVGPNAPYVAMLPPNFFRRSNVMRLKDSGKVSGLLVLNRTNSPSSISNDLSCPNKYSGLYQSSSCDSKPWNPNGDGLLFEDLNFPIFFINENKLEQSVLLDDCFYKFNQPVDGKPPSYPLCSVELKAFMWAAVDTPTCLRRGRLNMLFNPQPSEYCDPLGSVNIFVPLLATNKSEGPVKNNSVIFISARMDSASMFDGLSTGADTAITGLATLIAVTEMLNKEEIINDISENTEDVDNIMLMLLNGESFDYIGSSRLVYDMVEQKFPLPLTDNPSQSPLLGLEHIKYWIELGSLADHNEQNIYLHSDPISTNDSRVDAQVSKVMDTLIKNRGQLQLKKVDKFVPLPPASLQSFLKKDQSIPGLLITNHESAFTNQFYNNEWDTLRAINSETLVQHLADVARTVSATAYELATGKPLDTRITANQSLIRETLDCYLANANCSLFNWLLNGKSGVPSNTVLPTYVGVSHGDNSYKPLALLTRYLLAYVSGRELPVNKTECIPTENDGNEIYQNYWMGESENVTGICLQSTVRTSNAVSPAFIIEDYDWASAEYPSWTESRWETFSTRIFLQPSKTQEVTVFVSGLIVFLVSIAVTYWASIKVDVLFPNSPEIAVC